MMEKTYPLQMCQWRLAVIWLLGSCVLFILMAFQVAGGKYGNEDQKAWGWLLPQVLPILSMIGGAIVYQMNRSDENIVVTSFAYRATWVVSLIYLLLVLTTVALVPIAEQEQGIKPIDFLPKMGPVLTGLSAIASSILAAFFVSSKPKA